MEDKILILIRRIDGDSGNAEWHILDKWNEINGYKAIDGDVITSDGKVIAPDGKVSQQKPKSAENQPAPASPSIPSVHGRLTPCLRCGRVYGPGMTHHCR